jgi:hypothetical protein
MPLTPDVQPEIISRDEAIALGLKRFFTGDPCKYGHISERYVSTPTAGTCIACLRVRKRAGGSSARPRKEERRRRQRRERESKLAYRALCELGLEFIPPLPLKQEPILMSRKEALALGLTRYFTGRPCTHGHICERSVSQETCLECLRVIKRRKRPSRGYRPEQRRRQRQRWRDARNALCEMGVNLRQQENS